MISRILPARPLLAMFVTLAVLVLLGSANSAVAHGYHLSANPQLTDDGTIVVQSLFALSDGFVVLHTDEGDGPGDPVGNVSVPAGFHRGVTVTADPAFWDGVRGNETLWVAFHSDDGDGTFEPGTDPIASFKGSNATDRVPVGAVDQGRTYVLGGGRNQKTSTSAVYVPRLALAEDGFVVLRSERGEEGRIVGHTSVGAGLHRRVRVPLNESFFASLDDWTTLQIVVYDDDGDDEFTAQDSPVRVNGQPIATRLTFEKINGTPVTPTLNSSPSPVGANESTPTPTPSLVTTPTDTRTPTPTAGTTTTTPGFTIIPMVAVLVGVIIALRTMRRGD